MFDSDHGMPLAAISGSPTGSTFDEPEDIISRYGQPTSYDSIMDGDPRSSVFDSLFDKTGYRPTHSNVDVFDIDVSHPAQGRHLRSAQFRPVSILSLGSVNDTMTKDDDTMISVRDNLLLYTIIRAHVYHRCSAEVMFVGVLSISG